MLLFFLLCFLNLAFGFAAAFWLERRRLRFHVEELSDSHDEELTEEQEEPEEEEVLPPEELGAGPECLPEEWRRSLDQEAIAPQTLLEAIVHTVRFRASSHLDRQIDLTRALAGLKDEEQAVSAADIPRKQAEHDREWLEFLEAVQATLEQHFGSFGRLAEIQVILDTALNAHLNEIRDLLETLAKINFGSDFRAAREATVDALQGEIVSINGLRDYLDEVFAQIISLEGRLDTVDRALLIDPETSLLNRAGLDQLLQEWSQLSNTPGHLAFVFFELDHFAQISHFNDLYIGDRLLQTLARLLDDNIRKTRGFDRLVRLSQGRILLVLGDTELQWASVPAERIRKLVEQARFRYGRVEMRLSVSCVLTELRNQETIDQVLSRLDQGLEQAREGEGNQTTVYRAGKYEVVEPNDDPVRQLEVEIDEREEVLA